eukprot:45532-Chlamydomonas_euryale.AAC.1
MRGLKKRQHPGPPASARTTANKCGTPCLVKVGEPKKGRKKKPKRERLRSHQLQPPVLKA